MNLPFACLFADRNALHATRPNARTGWRRDRGPVRPEVSLYHSAFDSAWKKHRVITTTVAEAIKSAVLEGCQSSGSWVPFLLCARLPCAVKTPFERHPLATLMDLCMPFLGGSARRDASWPTHARVTA